MSPGDDDHDLGLQHDLNMMLSRRRALGLTAAAGASAVLFGCGDGPSMSQAQAEQFAVGSDGAECVAHTEETAGPFPADGSNRAHGELANVLTESGVVREDIRKSVGGFDGEAQGAPLTLTMSLQNVETSCAPLAGYAVYLWHCDALGRYSIYEVADQNYLRGVGVSNAAGEVRFSTIFPGCYRGRYPHIHFEVYPSLEKATDYRNRILTSQLAMPSQTCQRVYAEVAGYADSVSSFANVSLENDGIFRDNTAKQLTAQTPSVTQTDGGMTARVTVGLA